MRKGHYDIRTEKMNPISAAIALFLHNFVQISDASSVNLVYCAKLYLEVCNTRSKLVRGTYHIFRTVYFDHDWQMNSLRLLSIVENVNRSIEKIFSMDFLVDQLSFLWFLMFSTFFCFTFHIIMNSLEFSGLKICQVSVL